MILSFSYGHFVGRKADLSTLVKRFFFFFCFFASTLLGGRAAHAVCGTPGKDGVGPAGGVVNTYIASAQSASVGDHSLVLNISSRTGAPNLVQPGDLLLLWQMQGASIDSSNTDNYGSGTAQTYPSGYTSLNSAGYYEFVRVTSPISPTGFVGVAGDGPGGGVRFSYVFDLSGSPRRTFQVVRVPQYSSMTLTSPLTPIKFNGTTGGILVVDVAGTLTFSTPTAASVYQTGFRGGFAPVNQAVNSNSNEVYTVSTTPRNGAGKGEGIAGRPRYVWDEGTAVDNGVEGYPGGDGGRGAPANAGGGGNAHNAGGGGGANSGAGGRGGYPWEGQAKQTGTVYDTVANSGGGTRQVARACGSGGAALVNGAAPFVDRMFMGGGGGGGDANDALTGVRGGVGGGVILIRAGKFVGTTAFDARGDAGDRGAQGPNPDGAGGGGAGGTVILISKNPSSASISVNASGGSGGNTANDPADPSSGGGGGTTWHGPGGGGGGGTVLYSNNVSVTTNTAGGPAGKTADGAGANHGTTPGSAGLSKTLSASDGNNLFDYSDSCGTNLVVTKTTSTPTIAPGGTTASYTITVSNTGAGGAAGVFVSDALPTPFSADIGTTATATFVIDSSGPATLASSSSTTTPVWGSPGADPTTSYDIGPGASLKLSFTVKINSAPVGLYNNSAQAFFSDPQRTTNTTVVSPGGTYTSGALVPGSNYNGTLPANTADDVSIAGTLSGVVFEDNGAGSGGVANDGIRNGTEPPIGGVTLTLKDGATTLATTVSAGDGTYSFALPQSSKGHTLSVVETNATAYLSSGADAGNTGGTYTIATDTLAFPFTGTPATLTGANFGDIRAATLDTDGAKVGIRGGSVTYPHLFTANTTGTAFFSVAQVGTPAPGWSVALYLDTNGNGIIDAGEGEIFPTTPVNTVAGAKVSLIVVNYVPQNAPDGSTDNITLSASFTPAKGGTNAQLPAQSLTRTDLTTVGPQSGVSLVKSVDKTTAKSGDLLTYTIVYANTGNAPVSQLVVNDVTPAFTTFQSASYVTPLPASLTGCTVAAPSIGGTGAVSWTFAGTLGAGARGTVTFVVKVN